MTHGSVTLEERLLLGIEDIQNLLLDLEGALDKK